MNEITLNDILVAAHDIEFAQYNNPEHAFSRRHVRVMKRIFKTYEMNVSKLLQKAIYKNQEQKSQIHWNRKTLAVVLVMIILAVLAGCAVIIYTLGGFNTKSYSDNTELFPIDYENAPSIIENEYYLSDLPTGFSEIITDRNDYCVYHYFKNEKNGQTITFRQVVKSLYKGHANTELGKLEEVEINGRIGVCLEYMDCNFIGCDIIWDNGTYIIEIMTDCTKYEALNLAKSTKIIQR